MADARSKRADSLPAFLISLCLVRCVYHFRVQCAYARVYFPRYARISAQCAHLFFRVCLSELRSAKRNTAVSLYMKSFALETVGVCAFSLLISFRMEISQCVSCIHEHACKSRALLLRKREFDNLAEA